MQRDTKIGLAILIIAIISAASVLMVLRFFVFPPNDGQNPSMETFRIYVIDGSDTVTITSTQIADMSYIEANSSFQNRYYNWRNPGTYRGVLISALIEQVGTMDSNDAVKVIASDGYPQFYSYDNIYPNTTFLELQGQLILAYEYNGSAPPSWSDGPRTVFLPDDEAYSVDDANKTTYPSWFDDTAGGRCVKNVETIELLHDAYPPPPQKIALSFPQYYLGSPINTFDSSLFICTYVYSPMVFHIFQDE
jgi:hypothetical protein